jgi:hypothetical protein
VSIPAPGFLRAISPAQAAGLALGAGRNPFPGDGCRDREGGGLPKAEIFQTCERWGKILVARTINSPSDSSTVSSP